MNFNYKPLRTVQAASLILKLHKRPIEYMKLIKLLYMSDRIALECMDDTITGDKYVSMDHGPVLSKVYDLINHGPKYDKDNPWFKYISSPNEYCVRLLNDPGNGELCEEDERIITSVYNSFGHIDIWSLSDITHFFPEWQNPYGSAIPIQIDSILRHLAKTEEHIEEIRKNIFKNNFLNMNYSNAPISTDSKDISSGFTITKLGALSLPIISPGFSK